MTHEANRRRGPGPLRTAFIVVAGIAALVYMASGVLSGVVDEAEPEPAVGEERLPDLVASPLIEFETGRNAAGTEVLFFSAEIENRGEGAFVLRAIRREGSSSWRVWQRIPHEQGYERIGVPAELEYAGDAHDHWHIRKAARYRLLGAAGDTREDNKVGFCFFDNLHEQPDLAGSPRDTVHPVDACGTRTAVELDMGLSIGWGDRYVWTLPGQSVDITGLEPGRYRLEMTADPDGWFRESRTDNNTTWADIELGRSADGLPTVRVIAKAPRN